jgi:hypothetical protein
MYLKQVLNRYNSKVPVYLNIRIFYLQNAVSAKYEIRTFYLNFQKERTWH